MIQHKRAFCCSDFGITAAAAEGIVYLDAESFVSELNKKSLVGL